MRLLPYLYLFLLLQLTACNSCETQTSEVIPVDFKLNWSVYGEHAPFYVAKELGFYKDQGLDVNIVLGNGSGSTTELVANGTFPLGYADTATQIKTASQGFATTNVAVFLQISPMSLITLKDSSIKTWDDLRGKKIGITVSDAASALFAIILGKLDLTESDLEVLPISYPSGRGKALLQGRVDAFLGYHINEPHKLHQQTNKEFSWLPVTDLGITFLSSGIIVNPDFLSKNESQVAKFVKASQKGLQYTIDHPRKAAEILATKTDELDVDTCEQMIQGHIKLIRTENSKGKPLGWTSEIDWDRTIHFIENYFDFRSGIKPTDFYTNKFVE